MRDVLSGKQTAVVLRCAPMKVKKRIAIGEWPGRIIPKSKTGLNLESFFVSARKRYSGDWRKRKEEQIECKGRDPDHRRGHALCKGPHGC